MFAMSPNEHYEETLIDQAVDWLNTALGSGVTASRQPRTVQTRSAEVIQQIDGLITIETQNARATLSVEAKATFTPRDVERLLDTQQRLAALAHVDLLLVAPWLSPRARDIIRARGANYLDLTGNCLIRLDNPSVFIRIDGAAKDPSPKTRAAGLRGAKTGRLVRVLAEASPPYGVRELAAKSGLTPGYVSRLLETLDREALVQREGRGRVRAVDYVRLIEQYAAQVSLLRTREAATFIAPAGARTALARLAQADRPTAVTGSFAAARLEPIAAPALLAVYTADVRAVAGSLRLLPADTGADVVLLVPPDPVVWDSVDTEDGVTYVAPAQVAMDCLAGNGRMPAEGAAVLEWMSAHENTWRAESLGELPRYGEGPP